MNEATADRGGGAALQSDTKQPLSRSVMADVDHFL